MLSQAQLARLLEDLCEDRISDADSARLEAEIVASPAARRFYVEYLNLHGSLYWDAACDTERLAEFAATIPGVEVLTPAAEEVAESRPLVATTAVYRRKAAWAMVTLAPCLLLAALFWIRNDRPAQMADRQTGPAEATIASTEPAIHPDRHGRPSTPAVATPAPTVAEGTPLPVTPPHRKPIEVAAAPAVPAVSPTPVAEVPSAEIVSAEPAESPRYAEFFADPVVGINAALRTSWRTSGVSPSPIADDASWLRRIYLDLVGHIPTAAEVEDFVADRTPDKRARVVDRLVEEPGFARNFATVWTNLLVGRRETEGLSRDGLQKYLRVSFAGNRPWDRMVTELVAAEGNSQEDGASNFLLAHLNNDAVPATAITARLFLCQQIQCTQCHNHPFNDGRQALFWELNSFFQQTASLPRYETDKKTGTRHLASYDLVDQDVGGPIYYETRTGLMLAAFPRFEGREVDPAPSTHRRQELARLLTSGDDPQLAAAFVNRLWSHFFSYGFTRPVDDMGPHNPPSHPELLDDLARSFVANDYNVKDLVRWICLSEAYQLSSGATPKNRDDEPSRGDAPLFSRMYVKSLTAEQLYDSMIIATGAHRAGTSDWTVAEEQRQAWLQQYIYDTETDENTEINTFDGTISQALTLMNGPIMQEALRGRPGSVLHDVLRRPGSDNDKVRRLTLATLSREPTPRELALMRKAVGDGGRSRPPAPEAYQDVLWALLNSNEFTLNR